MLVAWSHFQSLRSAGLIAPLAQSSLSFAPPKEDDMDPWDLAQRRKNRGGVKKSEPSSKPLRTLNKPDRKSVV